MLLAAGSGFRGDKYFVWTSVTTRIFDAAIGTLSRDDDVQPTSRRRVAVGTQDTLYTQLALTLIQ